MQLVLILEDDVLLRAGMARSLGKLPSIEVVEAATIEEAILLVDSLPVDLVLSDLQLGDGTALELLPKLARPAGPIPVVLISGCLDKFEGRLPSGIEVRSKPIVPIALRELVARTLGCTETRPPFALADYIQLASYGRHSVQINLGTAAGHLGAVTIRDGLPWSAVDAQGSGFEAFLRLMGQLDVTIECGAVVAPTPSSLTGTCDGLLIEAARVLDERRAGRRTASPPPVTTTVTVTAQVPPVVKIPPRSLPAVPALAVAVPRTSSRPELSTACRPPAAPPPDFDDLYDLGIDALLARRYQDAFDALTRARALRTTPTLEANLHRLRAMGFE